MEEEKPQEKVKELVPFTLHVWVPIFLDGDGNPEEMRKVHCEGRYKSLSEAKIAGDAIFNNTQIPGMEALINSYLVFEDESIKISLMQRDAGFPWVSPHREGEKEEEKDVE